MSDVCKSCRWPVRLHHSGTLGCPPGVHLDATADELWEWLCTDDRELDIEYFGQRRTKVHVWHADDNHNYRSFDKTAPTLTAALRAVCAEVLSK